MGMVAGLIGLVGLIAGDASSWQIAAAPRAARGSEAAMPAAQQAAIGAKICTAKANMTIGRNFRNRRRISTTLSDRTI